MSDQNKCAEMNRLNLKRKSPHKQENREQKEVQRRHGTAHGSGEEKRDPASADPGTDGNLMNYRFRVRVYFLFLTVLCYRKCDCDLGRWKGIPKYLKYLKVLHLLEYSGVPPEDSAGDTLDLQCTGYTLLSPSSPARQLQVN
jgi:hypothetical protein